RRLPLTGYYGLVVDVLKKTSDAQKMYEMIQSRFALRSPEERNVSVQRSMQALDAMITDGWVGRSVQKNRRAIMLEIGKTRFVRTAAEMEVVVRRGSKATVKSNI
ncbi:MAG: hypothetical protein ACTS27_12210, partial [Phycisphaerales bacterium]